MHLRQSLEAQHERLRHHVVVYITTSQPHEKHEFSNAKE